MELMEPILEWKEKKNEEESLRIIMVCLLKNNKIWFHMYTKVYMWNECVLIF